MFVLTWNMLVNHWAYSVVLSACVMEHVASYLLLCELKARLNPTVEVTLSPGLPAHTNPMQVSFLLPHCGRILLPWLLATFSFHLHHLKIKLLFFQRAVSISDPPPCWSDVPDVLGFSRKPWQRNLHLKTYINTMWAECMQFPALYCVW